jgi:hypothetical protein
MYVRTLSIIEIPNVAGGQGRSPRPSNIERGFEEAINNHWNPAPDTIENMRRASGNITFQQSLVGQAMNALYDAIANGTQSAIRSAVNGLSAAWDAYVKDYSDRKEEEYSKKND